MIDPRCRENKALANLCAAVGVALHCGDTAREAEAVVFALIAVTLLTNKPGVMDEVVRIHEQANALRSVAA